MDTVADAAAAPLPQRTTSKKGKGGDNGAFPLSCNGGVRCVTVVTIASSLHGRCASVRAALALAAQA